MRKGDQKFNDNLDYLMDASMEIVSIECTKCHKIVSVIYFNAEDFYNKGWRATANNVYCPKDAKKYKIK